MAMLNDVSSGALPADDPTKQVESMVRQVNEWARSISNEDRTKIYKDESGTNRIILGLLPDKTIGLKISQPDIDVVGAGDDELVFNSNQNVFKIVDSGTTALTMSDGTSGSTSTVTISHNLGYIPIVIAYFNDGGVYRPIPNWSGALSFDTVNDAIKFSAYVDMTVTSTNLNFIGYSTLTGASPAYSIKYYLLQESAN